MKSKVFGLGIFYCVIVGLTFGQHITRGPYLQLNTPESIIIRWRTDIPTDSRVLYGATPEELSWVVYDSSQSTDHSIQLSGLQSFSTYFYAVGTKSIILSGPDSDHFFKTHPASLSHDQVRFWVTGDFGKGNLPQKKVRDAYTDYAENEGPADLWLWLGDNAYDSGTDEEFQLKVFDTVNGYQSIMKNLPFWPCPGNHDYGNQQILSDPDDQSVPYFDIVDVPQQGEAGGVPSGNELYYSFNYGNVHFISLNSEVRDWTGAIPFPPFSSSPMSEWLELDLQTNEKEWVVVFWHQCPYTKGSHDSDDLYEIYMTAMRQNFNPIIEEYGVDLVLSGHSHVYERSYLIKGHYGYTSSFQPGMIVNNGSGYAYEGQPYIKNVTGPDANEGTVYAVVGNSGSSTSSPSLDHPVMYFNYGCDTCVGSLLIDVNGNRMDAQYLTAEGDIMDEFSIIKSDTMLGIADSDPDPFQMRIFPNPTMSTSSVDFFLRTQSRIRLDITDTQGILIFRLIDEIKLPGKHSFSLNSVLKELNPGVFIVKLSSEKEGVVEKLLNFGQ